MDFKDYCQKNQPAKVLLVHHWDCDGLCCSVLFKQFFKKYYPQTQLELTMPTINNYFLLTAEYQRIKEFNSEVLIVTDINFELKIIEELEKICPSVFVFDHHAQTAHIHRPGKQDTVYPACSMLVAEYFNQADSLLAILGMIGDQEDRLQGNEKFFPKVEQAINQYGISLQQLLKITHLADTAYIRGKLSDVYYVLDLLLQDPTAILKNERLLANEDLIKKEIDREIQKEMQTVGQHLLYQNIASAMNIISPIARAKSRQHPHDIVMIDQVNGLTANIYLRHRQENLDLGKVVAQARGHGYNAGGKAEVAGIILPAAEATSFKQEIIK